MDIDSSERLTLTFADDLDFATNGNEALVGSIGLDIDQNPTTGNSGVEVTLAFGNNSDNGLYNLYDSNGSYIGGGVVNVSYEGYRATINLAAISDSVMPYTDFQRVDYSGTVNGDIFIGTTADAEDNDAPVVNDATFSLDENSSNSTVVGSVSASDVDGDNLTYAITAGNTDNAFAIDSNGQITVNNSAALNFETTPTFTLTVTVTDNGSQPLSDAATITINLTDVNEPTVGGDLIGRAVNTWWVAKSNGTDGFTNHNFGAWESNAGWTDVQTGDFNNDGLTDVAGRNSSGQWWVGVNTGANFNTQLWGYWVPSLNWQDVQVADVDNDGDSDIVGRSSTGDWWVARSNGSSFNNERWGRWSPNVTWSNVMVADINGDGSDDIVGQTPNGQWWAARSNGTDGFMTELWGYFAAQANWQDVQVGDFNGDGNDDVVGRTSSGAWWVGLSNGTNGFTNQNWGGWSASAGWMDVLVADLNGDGNDDIIGRTSNGQWWAAQSTGSSFTREYWGYWVPSLNWQDVNVIDVDQDGNQDLIGRASNGGLWVAQSNGQNFTNQLWGFWNPNVDWQNVMTFDGGSTSPSNAFVPNAFAEDDDQQVWTWNT